MKTEEKIRRRMLYQAEKARRTTAAMAGVQNALRGFGTKTRLKILKAAAILLDVPMRP